MAGPRLVIVTGKGGVGKTTVAAAVAQAAVAARRRALLVEVATPGRLASVLDVPRLDAEPRQIVDGLSAVALEEGAALEELVHGLMPLRLLSRRLLSSETFRIIAAAVPGILEAALLARVVAWLEERDRRGRQRFEVVVLDSPASGHSVPLLATPRTLSGLATVGPLGAVMRRTSRWLSDPALTRALVVAIPEDWAIAEAVELYASLRDGLAIPVGRPVLNAVFPRRFSHADEALLHQAEASRTVAPELLEAGRYFVERRNAGQLQARALRKATRVRPLELPFVFSASMTWDDLGPLADALDPILEPA
jgi:anion-transporting  ArsA/GET3 family ATPase